MHCRRRHRMNLLGQQERYLNRVSRVESGKDAMNHSNPRTHSTLCVYHGNKFLCNR